MLPGPAATELPGKLLEMQILEPDPDLLNRNCEGKAQHSVSLPVPPGVEDTLEFENRCPQASTIKCYLLGRAFLLGLPLENQVPLHGEGFISQNGFMSNRIF